MSSVDDHESALAQARMPDHLKELARKASDRSYGDSIDNNSDVDADTASARSICLSSPPESPRRGSQYTTTHTFSSFSSAKRESHAYTLETDFSSDMDDVSLYKTRASSVTSAAASIHEQDKATHDSSAQRSDSATAAGPPPRKERPESLLPESNKGTLVLGIALVDFNHLVGPRVEFSRGPIFDDEELSKTLPFLALPDGAHMSAEDYCYFHLVPSSSNPTTVFGLSCNMQIATSALLAKGEDVTRSTVQKAVVVLASKPAFGPVRDKLGVVTRALFNQRDFREMDILLDFHTSLEFSLRTHMTESGFYMGTSLRELVHIFRHRTLVLLKALMLQKRIMFFGHPVERLCTYQYSLVSLMPNLLHTLDDCGSPPLAERARTLSQPTSLRTSDHKSMMAYVGLPLDLFGKDAFFQPYLPLQQLDMIKESRSWLCGTTNSILTQQKEIDLLINIETGAFEFRDPTLERSAGLTPADRKWIDGIVRDVNDGWSDEDPTRPTGMQFKGSDDYLRAKFEEYISAALSSVRYHDFVAGGKATGTLVTGGSASEAVSTEDFNPLWIAEFKRTNAYDVWERTTDPMLFDIVEARHPCNEKPSVVTDISLRLQEGIQELKLEQQLAPTREAISRTISAGSTNFFKAVEGVRGRWGQRLGGSTEATTSSRSGTPVETTPRQHSRTTPTTEKPLTLSSRSSMVSMASVDSPVSTRPASVVSTSSEAKAVLSGWGSGIGSFLSSKASRFSLPSVAPTTLNKAVPPIPIDEEDETPLPAPPAREKKPVPSLPPIDTSATMANVGTTSRRKIIAIGGPEEAADEVADETITPRFLDGQEPEAGPVAL